MREFQRAVELSNGAPAHLADLARFHAASGRRDEAQKLLARIPKSGNPYPLALAYAAAGMKAEAVRQIDLAIQTRRPPGIILARLNILRSEPDYALLLRRLGLP
jgi:hypothetical protein